MKERLSSSGVLSSCKYHSPRDAGKDLFFFINSWFPVQSKDFKTFVCSGEVGMMLSVMPQSILHLMVALGPALLPHKVLKSRS